MKCPNCGNNLRGSRDVCANCGYRLSTGEAAEKTQSLHPSHLLNALIRLALILFSIGFFGYLIYTGYFWFDAWRVNRVYASQGALREPEIEQIVMEDGRLAHVLTFYGPDGDELFIPELNKSYLFVGGMTEITIPDSSWFDARPDDDEMAVITMMPVIYTAGNGLIRLPALELSVETPESPLTLVNPSTESTQVNTSIYTLEIKVVPGSEVLIGGEDFTDMVSYDGLLSRNINVYPVGDNNISINVRTPHHKQARRDIVLTRPPQAINLEPDLNLTKSTNKNVVTISGMSEPGASIVVDSKYVEDSIKVSGTGAFSFKARLSIVGDNVITFHAVKDGKEEYLSVTVYYVPTLNEYSRKAWPVDYENMPKMTEQWAGQEFKCVGPVVEVFEEDGVNLIAMDVASEGAERQIVILENKSSLTALNIGQKYTAWADLDDTYFYEDNRCPKLIARYIQE